MSGPLLNGTKDDAPEAALSDSVLQAAQDKIESQLDETTRANVDKIVVAGMHAALDKGPGGILASLKQSADPVSDAAKGAVALVLILRHQAKGVMPLKAMVPAASILMIKALDFADRSGIAKIGTPELVRATHILTDAIFKAAGITKSGLASAAEKVHALTNDPAAMSAINLKAGITKHPQATTPTPLPQ